MDTDLSSGFPYGYVAKAQRILKAGKEGKDDMTRVVDLEVIEILNALIELDKDAAEKIGPGIDYWVTHYNNDLEPPRNSQGYRIMRVDGTGPVTFGYTDVLKPKAHESFVKRALSEEVADLMVEFRKSKLADGPVTCNGTGRTLQRIEETQAKHVNPELKELHRDFIAHEGLTFDDIQYENLKNQGLGFRLVDRDLAERWRDFQSHNMDGLELRFLRRHDRPAATNI